MSRAGLFASDRERRLWAWTLAVLAGIWLTLGVAPLLTGALRDRGLLTAGFALGLALVGATAAAQGLRTRPSGAEAAVALGVTAVYLLVLVRMALPEERTHLIEYGVVAAFMHEALTERTDGKRRVLAALLASSARRSPARWTSASSCSCPTACLIRRISSSTSPPPRWPSRRAWRWAGRAAAQAAEDAAIGSWAYAV